MGIHFESIKSMYVCGVDGGLWACLCVDMLVCLCVSMLACLCVCLYICLSVHACVYVYYMLAFRILFSNHKIYPNNHLLKEIHNIT